MAVVRLISYINEERKYESLFVAKCEEWFRLSCSYKTKQVENLAIE